MYLGRKLECPLFAALPLQMSRLCMYTGKFLQVNFTTQPTLFFVLQFRHIGLHGYANSIRHEVSWGNGLRASGPCHEVSVLRCFSISCFEGLLVNEQLFAVLLVRCSAGTTKRTCIADVASLASILAGIYRMSKYTYICIYIKREGETNNESFL